MKSLKIAVVLLLVLSAFSFAQKKADYTKEPGYYDLNDFAQFKNSEPTTEIYLEEPMLKMIAGLTDEKKEGLGEMIAGLKLISVTEYEIDSKEFSSVESLFITVDKNLSSKQWDRIIRSKQKNNFDNVYVRRDQNNEFSGLVITSMHLDADEKSMGRVTFVNIVGKINLSSLGELSKKFNIPQINKSKETEK